MYLTVKELADYLSLPEVYIEALIEQKKIRAVYDGEQYLVNKDNFKNYHEQLETYKKLFEQWQNEPIPEDPDIKDED
ncbi:helix-turn-helix domain-containing protein [Rossellomorea vietnamensis]|uniref:Helix-turn-helix domain-containing protein n=1 Tax=Rossellomorea vietnamensis TaxID=218284 RepID=A0A5D4MDT8_9BACI|nr:excisionase family DNA-binding protein [Rossellomorea vietnamensis]TYR99842.1 helix-turn-helix domain-containing protein [Rossellomorea vietnamensis]